MVVFGSSMWGVTLRVNVRFHSLDVFGGKLEHSVAGVHERLDAALVLAAQYAEEACATRDAG